MRGIFLFQVSREIPKSAPASQPKESASGFFKSTLVGLAIFSLENDALKYSPQKISGIISNYEDFMSLLVGKEGLLRTKGLDKPESFQGMLNTWSEISSVMYSNFTFWSTATLTEAFTRDRELSFTVRIPQPSMGKVKLSFGGGNSIEIQEADLAGLEKPGSTISGSAYGLPFTLEKTGDSINISARGNFIDCDTSVFAAADALAQIGIKTKVVYVPGHALLKIEAGKGGKPLEKPLYIETTSNFQQRLHELGNDGLGFLFYDSEDQVRKNRGTIYCEVPFSDLLGYKTRTYVENDEEKNIASLSKYLESVPNDADAHDSRGTFYWRNYWQQPQKAISDFTRAIELCPSEPRFYFDRADPRKMVGMRDLAAEDYKKAGSLYFDKLDYQSAIDSCCRCLEIAPGDSDALILRAKAFELTGKFSDAIIDYEKALKAKPDSLDACISLARVHVILNQYGEAELAYSKALKLGSKKPEHLSGYADMLARGGQFGKALGYYLKTALAYESVGNVLDGARARHAASYCHQMAGDFSKAAQEYLMAARAFEGELKKGNPSVSIDAVISCCVTAPMEPV